MYAPCKEIARSVASGGTPRTGLPCVLRSYMKPTYLPKDRVTLAMRKEKQNYEMAVLKYVHKNVASQGA